MDRLPIRADCEDELALDVSGLEQPVCLRDLLEWKHRADDGLSCPASIAARSSSNRLRSLRSSKTPCTVIARFPLPEVSKNVYIDDYTGVVTGVVTIRKRRRKCRERPSGSVRLPTRRCKT